MWKSPQNCTQEESELLQKKGEITDENEKWLKKMDKSSQALSLQKYNTLRFAVKGCVNFADYYTLYSPFVFSLANSLQ